MVAQLEKMSIFYDHTVFYPLYDRGGTECTTTRTGFVYMDSSDVISTRIKTIF